jgi:hypothetical protein
MTTVTVIIVVLVVAALLAAAFSLYQKQRRAQLQERFGPEYDRAVEGAQTRREAEQHLAGVAQRRDKLNIRDLDDAERSRYTAEWEAVQARFVDQPGKAVDGAEVLIATVMRDRGYPVDDFDQQAELVAADHPDVVQHYRDAHTAHERHRSAGGVDTEDLRQSFVHYRALFVVLVQNDDLLPEATDASDATDATDVDPAEQDADRPELIAAEQDADRPELSPAEQDADRPELIAAEQVGAGPANPAVTETADDPDGVRSSHPQETR